MEMGAPVVPVLAPALPLSLPGNTGAAGSWAGPCVESAGILTFAGAAGILAAPGILGGIATGGGGGVREAAAGGIKFIGVPRPGGPRAEGIDGRVGGLGRASGALTVGRVGNDGGR